MLLRTILAAVTTYSIKINFNFFYQIIFKNKEILIFNYKFKFEITKNKINIFHKV